MRFRAVDTFRGMAAIMVILFHLQHLTVLSGIAFIAKSDIFVDFFFVLSGFVITYSNYDKITNLQSIKPFAIKRFKRLYPLHLFTLLLVLMFELFRYGVDHYIVKLSNPVFAEDKSFLSFLANLTLTQSLNLFDRITWNGPSWSISVEFYTYLIWAFCLVLFRKNLLIICGLCFSLIAWFIIRHNGNIIYNYDYGIVRCLYSFLVGMLTYRLSRQLSPTGNFLAISVSEVLLLGLTMYSVSVFTHSESWLMPFLFALVILVFSREKGAISKILAADRFEFLGKLSYSYYLNHMIVLNVMDLLLFKIIKLPASMLGESLYILVCLGCVHLLSVFTYRHIELLLQSPSSTRSVKSVAEATAF
ncbi:acyltransferase family protein [Spirosoma sp. HMF3257]|uniref:Acyltransferase n=1 Tax=Spirosoma telluris TaxID=2183553 RepID=A0A327NGZ0_9BACT|nr:acyltransferase family protein [Spirosoma telluris]RAI74063.1 acyltransferase [Spirosoma telluris]